MKMSKTLGSLRNSLLLLQSLWCKDKNYWIDEYPIETELYILNRVIKDLKEWYRYFIKEAHNPKNATDKEFTNHMLDTAAEIYLHVQIAKDRYEYLKSKHSTPIWLTQITNRLKLLIHKYLYDLVNFHAGKKLSRT